MRKKINFLKSFLLFLFLSVASVTAMKAQEQETLPSFTFNDHEGWTVVDDGASKYFSLREKTHFIQMDEDFNFSSYVISSITIQARTVYGTDTDTDVLRVSMGGEEILTLQCTTSSESTSYTINSDAFSHQLTGTGKIKIDCPGADGNKGVGVKSFTLNGTLKVVEGLVAPTFSPVAGKQESPAEVEYGTVVTASCLTDGATVTASIDGAPSPDATVTITNLSQLVEATSSLDGETLSASGYYSAFIAAPTFTLEEGNIAVNSSLEITTTTPGVTIIYATGGDFMDYSGAITIPAAAGESITYFAKAVADNGLESPMSVVEYTVIAAPAVFETFSNIKYSSGYSKVEWTADDGTDWSSTDTRVDQKIDDSEAICIRKGTMTSATYTSGMGILSFKYKLAFSGSGDINVYVNDILKHTLTADSKTVSTFTEEINISGNVQLKLTSTNKGRPVIDDVSWTPYSESVVEQVATPVIAVTGNASGKGTKRVTISTATEDATIYFTLDGTDPTDASIAYTKPFVVRSASDVTIKAIAMKTDLTDSEIASAVCTAATDLPSISHGEGHTYHMNGFWQAADFEAVTSFVADDAATATELDFTGAEIDEAATDLAFPAGLNPNCLLRTTAPGRFRKNNVVENACANLELMDKHPFNTSSSITAAAGTYTRNFGDGAISGWYSLYLPFAMSADQINAAGFTLVEQLTGYNAETKSLEFTPVTATEANVPYIVLFDQLEGGNASTYTGGDISLPISGDVSTTNGESVVTNAVLKGTYEAMPAGSLTGKYVLNADGTSFQKAGENVVLSAFRVYLELTTTPSAAPRQLSISSGGEGGTTGVSTLNATGIRVYGDQGKIVVESSAEVLINVYGVDGSCLRKVVAPVGTSSINGLSKGLYIVNRQKVVVK